MQHVTRFFVIVTIVFATSALGAERKLQVKWEELAGVVQGKKVQMVLRDGADVEGKVEAVEAEALRVKLSKASGSHEKGVQLIPRTLISVIRFEGRSGPWRAISTAIGAGAGTVLAVGVYEYANNEGGADGDTAAFAAGLVGGGAGLGYLFGRSVDRHVFLVTIVD